MPLHPDWKEFLELLNSHGVEYLLVGAHARAYHGVPRYIRDIALFVRVSPQNATRLVHALRDFGFASLPITEEDFLTPGRVIQLGVEPYRIDLLTEISGEESDDAWSDRVTDELDGFQSRSSVCGLFAKTSSPLAGQETLPTWQT